MNPANIALSFQNLSISNLYPLKTILNNISGYVAKGGITAVLGECASGKSILMKCLSGRMRNFHVTGEIILDGNRIDPAALHNPISYVPQTDFLMGEYTPREILMFNCLLKHRKPQQRAEEEVERLLNSFGLSHIADSMIGTAFVRGISGGQRKRVEICSELIVANSLLMLDEPTSGLDGSIAFDILLCIKRLLVEKRGELSILLSIHQPNQRILELFDNIMLLHQGKMVFFGTLSESIQYFTTLGHPPHPLYTPTDYFLQVISQVGNVSSRTAGGTAAQKTMDNSEENEEGMVDLAGQFRCSKYGLLLNSLLRKLHLRCERYDQCAEDGLEEDLIIDDTKKCITPTTSISVLANNKHSTNPLDVEESELLDREEELAKQNLTTVQFHLRQFFILVKREVLLALRDPSLYLLQSLILCIFCFNVGAAYFDLHPRIDYSLVYVHGALFWLCGMMSFVQIFKVYHLCRNNARLDHEMANNTYSAGLYWFAEVITTMVLICCILPGTLITYSMVNLPIEAFPFCLLVLWLVAMTAETVLHFVAKLSTQPTVVIIISQSILVILQVFNGIFIHWKDCPSYWLWLQNMSFLMQMCRTLFIHENNFLSYQCKVNIFGECRNDLGMLFPCDDAPPNADGICEVSGSAMLQIWQGVPVHESRWTSFGYLTMIFVTVRIMSLFLMYYPIERIYFLVQQYHMGEFAKDYLQQKSKIYALEEQVKVLLRHDQQQDSGASQITKTNTSTNVTSSEKEIISFPENDIGIPEQQHVQSQIERTIDIPRYSMRTKMVVPPPPMESIAESPGSKEEMMTEQQGRSLSWKHLSVTLKTHAKKELLHSLSGIAVPGRILALMGPSGAGKTTLLNTLCNRIPYANISGDITYSGRKMTSKDLVYVPQFDEFNQNFTVFETIEYIGMMKCTEQRTVRHRTFQLIRILGLSSKMHVLTKSLTNGELKCVSVGMGMICNPNVLFLDEPTTGLDSNAAYSIVKHLTELCTVTKVVMIMTIHQPAQLVFDMLQDLYLLENGGRLAFSGPVNKAQAYFASIGASLTTTREGGFHCPEGVNLVDFYLDLVNTSPIVAYERMKQQQQERPTIIEESDHSSSKKSSSLSISLADNWSIHFQASSFYETIQGQLLHASKNTEMMSTIIMNTTATTVPTSNTTSTQPVPVTTTTTYSARLWYTMIYFARYYYRDYTFFHIRICFLILIALFLGTLYYDLQPVTSSVEQFSGAIFFGVWTTIACSLWTAKAHALDRIRVIEQIKNDVITPSIYCIAQFLVSLPLYFLTAIIFQSIFHWLTNMNPRIECFFFVICIAFGHLILMEAVMLCIVACLHSAMLSITFAMVIMGAFFLFPGYGILISDMPVWISWICYLIPTKYSLNGYVWSVMIDLDFVVTGLPVPMTVSGEMILNTYFDLHDIHPWAYWGILLLFALCLRCVHYLLLYRSVAPYLITYPNSTMKHRSFFLPQKPTHAAMVFPTA